MKNIRIVPRLDIKGTNLVKGIHLEGLRVLGKPFRFAENYYQTGADELIYMDVVASLYGRNSLIDIIKKTARNIFIPLTVGGGLRTLEDIQMVLRAGADKVCINTAAIKNPDFISDASRKFGSSTIVVSIEAIKHGIGDYEAYTENGRERTNINVFEWAKRAEQLGAGELMITSIDQEGTGNGYDTDLIGRISRMVSIPVIGCGGAGKLEDFEKACSNGFADALSMSSVLHYGFIKQFDVSMDLSPSDDSSFLKGNRTFSKVTLMNIPEIKDHLVKKGFSCRT
jgi:cyclase